MKRKAFTLIETMTILSVLVTISLFMLMNAKEYNLAAAKARNKYYQNSILDFISNSKHYCLAHKKSGYIYFDLDKSVIYFYADSRRICRLQAPQGIYLYDVNLHYGRMNINCDGSSADAYTISYKDSYNELHNITVGVGTNYVDIKQ